MIKFWLKIASDFEKPDKIHTLFKSEIEDKLWKLPINEMFLVGKNQFQKLNRMGIRTIGDLAKADKAIIIKNFVNMGILFGNMQIGESNEDVNYVQEKPKE